MKRALMSSELLPQLAPGARVAVIRIRSLGDSVLTTPAIALLKESRPDLRIAVVSDPHFAGVWEGNPHVQEVFEPRLAPLRRFRPDLCLNLHGGPRSARLTLLSGARFRAGFAHFPYARTYNVRIPTAQQILRVNRTVHTAEHIASAMFYLGVPPRPIPRAQLFDIAHHPPLAISGPYAVIHALAATPDKTWPARSFIHLAQYMKRELGLQPVFLAGPGEDISSFQMWPALAGASLRDAKSLLAHASLFLGNDSGPAHMAAALGVPALVLFGPSDPVIWAPWRAEGQAIVADGAIETIAEEKVLEELSRLGVHA